MASCRWPSRAREERAAIERRLAEPGPIETALEATSAILSSLSAGAGVVMVPTREPRLAQLSLVPLSPGRALAVLVGEDGAVENRVVPVPADLRSGALEEASNFITARLGGRTLAEAVQAMRAEIASGRSRARCREPRSGRARPCGVERGCGAPPGADRARGLEPAR